MVLNFLDKLNVNQRSYYLISSEFSMESQPQNIEFRNNPEMFTNEIIKQENPGDPVVPYMNFTGP